MLQDHIFRCLFSACRLQIRYDPDGWVGAKFLYFILVNLNKKHGQIFFASLEIVVVYLPVQIYADSSVQTFPQ